MNHILKGEWDSKKVWLDGERLYPERSQNVLNHSPDGFNWSYSGSGPAQLALAIILDLGKDISTYQDFKRTIIAELPAADFQIEFEM